MLKITFFLLLSLLSFGHCQMEPCRTDIKPDPGSALDTYHVDLDTDPKSRWIGPALARNDDIHRILKYLFAALPKWVSPEVVAFLNSDVSPLAKEMGPPGLEMAGISAATGIPLGKIVAMNIFYELFTACTSIVGTTSDGSVVHGRNLDFGLFFGRNHKNATWELTNLLRPLLANVVYTKNQGKDVVFTATHYIGYVGVLTGMNKHFSVTIDDRFALDGGFEGIIQWYKGNRKEKWVSLITRELLESGANFTEAVDTLQKVELVAPVYYILGGANPGEGAVITRARNESLIFRKIGDPTPASHYDNGLNQPAVLETNYDWSKPAPFFDARRPAAVKCMNEIPKGGINFSTIYSVLSTKPVLNQLTTYTVLMHPSSGAYETYERFCRDTSGDPYPCSLW